jgi:hypothetical protein
MKKLWHCTRLACVDKIIKEGLKAFVPAQRTYKPKGIYLSEYQFNWMWNTQRSGLVKGACILLNVEGLELKDDFHTDQLDLNYNSKRIGKDYIYQGDIGVDRIEEIWIETEPNSFQKLEKWKKIK